MTKLRDDWASKFHMVVGYRAVEDEEDLRAFNHFIKGIIQSERQKWNHNQEAAKGGKDSMTFLDKTKSKSLDKPPRKSLKIYADQITNSLNVRFINPKE